MIIIDYKKNQSFINEKYLKIRRKIIVYCSLVILYLLITLTYSANFLFGLEKILNLLISTIPIIILFNYLLFTLNELRIKVFIISLVILSVLSSLFVISAYPFNHADVYQLSIERWSHVAYGRFISSAFIILLIYFFSLQNKKEVLLYSLPLPLIFFSLYITGLRAALLGVMLITLVLFFFYFKDLAKKRLNYIVFVIAGIIISFFILYSNIDTKIINRYGALADIEKLNFEGDPSINDRIQSIELSWEIFKNNFFPGTGFGGFRNYENNAYTEYLKYPHNIFLEFAVELGIPGILLSFFLLYMIFTFTKKISINIMIFFLFAFWLTLFSKDIPSNTLLWIGFGFYGFQNSYDRYRIPDA